MAASDPMKILFAYDGSESSEAALRAAPSILGRSGIEAVVLSIWEPLTLGALQAASFGGPPVVPLDAPELDEQSEEQTRKVAEHGAEVARELGFDARSIAVADTEQVAGTILATADKLDADLIVLGARGLAGIRAFLGSVSNHVLQHADRPVLVIPFKAAAHSEAGTAS